MMDIDQARTFLAVITHGSFVTASEHLHITQTAVSARIKALERELDTRLFARDKLGARLTSAGERFVAPAMTLVTVWEDARQQVAMPPGRAQLLRLGGEPSLWTPLLADWLLWMKQECPEVAVRVDVEPADRLIERVGSGALDLAVVYGIRQSATLVTEVLSAETLVMVTSDPGGRWSADTYVHVDWGAAFTASSRAAFPQLDRTAVSTSFGPLAMGYIERAGGSGYFRATAVQPALAQRRLFRVPEAPEFSYSIYAVYAPGRVDAATRGESDAWLRARSGIKACLSQRRGEAGPRRLPPADPAAP